MVPTTTFILMIAVSLLFDGIIAAPKLLDLIPALDILTAPANIMVSILVGIWAWLTFYVWFKLHGVTFSSPKRMFSLPAAFILKLIPFLGMLPEWTGAVTLLFITTRGEEELAKTLEKVGKVAGGVSKVASVASKVTPNPVMRQGLKRVSDGAQKVSRTAQENAEQVRSLKGSSAGALSGNQTASINTPGRLPTPTGQPGITAGQPPANQERATEQTPRPTAHQDIGAQPVFRQPPPTSPQHQTQTSPSSDERANATAENISRTTALQQGVSPEEAVEETRKRNQASTPHPENSAPKRPNPPPLPPPTSPQTLKPQAGQPTGTSSVPAQNKGGASAVPAPTPVNTQTPLGQPSKGSTGQPNPVAPRVSSPPSAKPQVATPPAGPPANAPANKPETGTSTPTHSSQKTETKQPTEPAPRTAGHSTLVPTPSQSTPLGQTAQTENPSSSESPKLPVAPRSEPPGTGQSPIKPSVIDRSSLGQEGSVPQTPTSTAPSPSDLQRGTAQRRGDIKEALKDLEKTRESNRKELKETLKQVLDAVQKGKKLP